MKNGGGGGPENKLLKGKIFRFALELLRYKKCILSCHPEDEIRRISKKKDKKCAFTLAEVLITLGIIGIIVAMTLPTIINKTQKKILATQLKTTYTILLTALERATLDHEDYRYWKFKAPDIDVSTSSYEFTKTYLKPYLKNTKMVREDKLSSCNNITYRYLDGSIASCNSVLGFCGTCGSASGSNMTQLYLSNGAIVVVLVRYGEDDSSYGTAEFHIDINGYKGPNVWGKDVFRIALNDYPNKGKYIFGNPDGHSRAFLLREHCTKTTAYECAAVLMMDGWEFKDDYPW